ncbi:MAG: FAD-dependent monooxygenase, partial [Planctomycetota bacterium]|nr:FAD-dependent monooxygenase [Planctomycetota bacterium]
DQEFEATQELFQQLMDERVPFPCELYNPGWMSRFRVHCRMVPEYQRGNVFLAGDGAHIHSPVGGRGMNMGIHDSFNLAWKLALVHQGHSQPSLLESYHIERHEVAKTTLFETDVATRMSMLRNPVMKEIRDQLSSLVMLIPGVEKRMAEVTSNLAVNMRRSPIVAADRSSLLNAELYHHKHTENASIAEWVEFGFGPEAGDRVPDRVFGAEDNRRRCSTLLDGVRHVVMLFDGAASTPEGYLNLVHIAKEIRVRYEDVLKVYVVAPLPEVPEILKGEESLLLDPSGDLHCSFGARAECLYVIRPDTYIGYRSQPANLEKALEYLRGIFSAR